MKRAIPLLLVLACAVVLTIAGIHHYISFAQLKLHHAALRAYVEAHPVAGAFGYIGSYALVVALSIPGVTEIFTLLAGVLFPQPEATVYAVVGATCGATAIFWIAGWAFRDILSNNHNQICRDLAEGFRRNGAWYLLLLRLLPLFPFWMVNLFMALFPIPLWQFALMTGLGIIPIVWAHVEVGEGLVPLLVSHQRLHFKEILTPQFELALCALALLALTPLVLKWWQQRKQRG